MSKLTGYEKAVLEKLLHNACIARDGGRCVRCGRTEKLCASHIYRKGTYQRMRYLLENTLTLCFYCHMRWWHKNPLEASAWAQTVVAPETMARLKLASQTINKKPIDYKLLGVYLKSEIKKHENA